MAGKRAARLKSTTDVSAFLGKLINRVDRGDVDAKKAGTLGYLANILLRSLEQSDLETRIENLEKKLKG